MDDILICYSWFIIVFSDSMSGKGSVLMKNAQIEKTKQTIDQLVEWYAKKQEFFKIYVPIQQSIIKKLLAAPEITINRIKEITQIVAEEKQLQALIFERTQKGVLTDEARFMPKTEEKVDPKDPKASKIKQELPIWSNNIDRVLLSMSRSYKQRRGRTKLVYKTLDSIQGELGKEQQRYRSQIKKEEKELEKLFQRLDEHEKQSSKILGKIIKESKGENIKDSSFFIAEIKNIEKNLHGQFDSLIQRNQIVVKIIQMIIKNEKSVSKKMKEQLTSFLNYRRQNYGKQSKIDEQVWGFLSIAEQRIEEQRLRYLNAVLLKPQRIEQLKSIIQKGQLKNNWQVIVKFLELSKVDMMRPISASEEIGRLMKNISYRCWGGISLAQGWLIESYTPAVLYMTYDYIMIIYNLSGELLKKINTNSSKIKKTEGQTVFLQEKLKGFFSDSIEEYKLRFEDVQRMEQFQLFIDNQVK